MRILVPALLLCTAPVSAASPAKPQPHLQPLRAPAYAFSGCRTGPTLAQTAPKADRPQKLGELPPGKLYLSVVRTLDGCPVPAMSQTRIGR
jgi:hypothetical protein